MGAKIAARMINDLKLDDIGFATFLSDEELDLEAFQILLLHPNRKNPNRFA